MKRSFTSIIFIIALSSIASAQEHYYWYDSKKVPLRIDPSYTFLKLESNDVNEKVLSKDKVAVQLKINGADVFNYADNEFFVRSANFSVSKSSTSSFRISFSSSMYKTQEGNMMVLLPNIVLEVNEGVSVKEILNAYKGTLTLKQDKGFNTYVLASTLSTSEQVLSVSNELNEKKQLVKWAEPEFYSNGKPANTLYPQQYYLHNTGQNGGTVGMDINVENAWSITNGSSTLRVAVVDDGVDNAHEDLTPRVVNGTTAGVTGGIGLPQNGVKGHGTACAGIIAATNNLIGIRGIASNVLIVPINIIPNTPVPNVSEGFATNAQIATAIDWAWNQGAADVITCSWSMGSPSNDITNAINRARTQGRPRGTSNYGAVFIASAGNDGNATNVAFPANLPGVITVGAIDNTGTIWPYSQTGPSMELVAPSGQQNAFGDVVTTDRTGTAGYAAGNYMPNFGGTSAAAPQAAGVVALILSEDPNLFETQAKIQIQSTAVDMGPAGFDSIYGYGRINACAAVNGALAGALMMSAPEVICSGSVQDTLYWRNGAPGTSGTVFTGALTWTSSDPSVLTVSSTGNPVTLTKVGNGTATITATHTNACGTITRSRTIGVGVPATPTISTSYQGGTSYIFTASYTGVGLHFNWWVDGVQRRTNSDNITYWDIPCQQSIRIKCNQTNTCGTSNMSQEEWVVNYNCYPFMALSVSPNPSTGMVTVSLQNNAADKKATTAPAKQVLIKEISLYDQSGGLRKKWKVNNTATYQINVSEFPGGVYFIEVNDGTQKQRQQLLIQK
jgi:subtilisin family serine protease